MVSLGKEIGWILTLSLPLLVTIKMHTCDANDKSEPPPAGGTCQERALCAARADPTRKGPALVSSHPMDHRPAGVSPTVTEGSLRGCAPEQEARPPRPQALCYCWHRQRLQALFWLVQPSREHRAAVPPLRFGCVSLEMPLPRQAWSPIRQQFSPTEVKFVHARALVLASKEFLLV